MRDQLGKVFVADPQPVDYSDLFDPDIWRQIQWMSLPEDERERSEALGKAMNRARINNPLAY